MNQKTIRRIMACLCMGGFLLLLAVVVTEHAAGFDDPIRQAFYALREDGLTQGLIPVTNLANKFFLIGLCLLLLIIPKTRFSFGVPLSAISLAAVLINTCLKHLVSRPRPEIQHLVAEHGFSFPSGHSISSMAFYGLAIWLIWHNAQPAGGPTLDHASGPTLGPDGPTLDQTIGSTLGPDGPTLDSNGIRYEKRTAIVLTIILLIPLVLVGLTRIYLGVHYPTDVLAGWCLGGFLVFISIEVIETIERRKIDRAPSNSDASMK